MPFFTGFITNLKGRVMVTRKPGSPYTCGDYRQEMVLLALKKRLAEGGLAPEEKRIIEKEVAELEKEMGMA